MRILFLAHPYLNLHQPIIDELVNCGHEVVFIEDKMLTFDFSSRLLSPAKKFVYKHLNTLFKIESNYWKYKFSSQKDIFNSRYDLFFCIQGLSFSPILLEHLKLYNKNIKTSLYIWDSNKYYDFFKNAVYFKNVYTFDLDDALLYNVNFLPFYWCNTKCNRDILYDLSMIGSEHDNRLSIVEKIKEQLVLYNISHFIKIYIPIKKNKLSYLKLFLYTVLGDIHRLNKLKLHLGLNKSEFIINKPIPIQEVNKIIQESRCILDTDRSTQTGVTPRLIWALALGKKIITTNRNIKNMPFYNNLQISVIDRNNPILDYDFIKSDIRFKNNEYIQNLRIDKWIKNFI